MVRYLRRTQKGALPRPPDVLGLVKRHGLWDVEYSEGSLVHVFGVWQWILGRPYQLGDMLNGHLYLFSVVMWSLQQDGFRVARYLTYIVTQGSRSQVAKERASQVEPGSPLFTWPSELYQITSHAFSLLEVGHLGKPIFKGWGRGRWPHRFTKGESESVWNVFKLSGIARRKFIYNYQKKKNVNKDMRCFLFFITWTFSLHWKGKSNCMTSLTIFLR